MTATATPTLGENCTLTQGYWKNHSNWPLDPGTLLCGMTWSSILQTTPSGDAWYNLAHQWIAAQLNAAKGASVPPTIQTAMAEAQALLTGNCASMPSNLVPEATGLTTLLDDYNSGRIGPGHCASEAVTGETVLYPNPTISGEPVYLHLSGLSAATDVNVKVFTLSFRKVAERDYSQVKPGMDLALSLTDQEGTSLANGLYYVEAIYRNGPPGSGASLVYWTGKMLILR